MKKRWLVIIALAVIAVVGGVLLYPAKPIQAAHTHSYRWVTKKNASCTSTGYRNYECSCGACLRSETIPKTPHNYNLNAATCTTAKKCRTCGYVAQAATGHTWNRASATCTASKSCTKCGAVGQAALGHAYCQVTTKQPTCGASGTYETKCSRCGVGSPTGNGTIPPTGQHSWNRSSASCTEAKKCVNCGTVGQAALGHAYSQVTTKQPTCGAAGTYETKCSRCGIGSPTGNGTIAPTGQHTWTYTSTTQPTCTANGYDLYTCSTCKQTKKETIEKLGHAYSQVTTKQPTCGAEGTYETKCSRCGIGSPTGNGTIAPTGKHTWKYTSTTESTCTANGYDLYTCSVCKQTKKETLDRIEHKYRLVVTKQPTKTENGVQSYMCSHCDAVKWTKALYLVSYNGNGAIKGTTPENQTKVSGSTLTLSIVAPRRTGYTFKGWGTTTSEVKYQPGDTYDKNARMNLYAIWEPYQYHIDFNANGGSGAPSGKIKTYGVSLTLPTETPTKKDYVFIGWAATSNATKASWAAGGAFAKNQDMTLYAVWAPDKFTVKYNLKGGIESGNAAFATKTYAYGTSVTIASVVPTKKGYVFKGWDTSSKAETVVYSPKETYAKYRNVTLYAVWGLHPFFENNSRFEPVESIKEPVNSGVEALKKTVEKTNGVMLAYKEIYEKRGIKRKPAGMSDDEYLADIWERSKTQRAIAKAGTGASYLYPTFMIGREVFTFLDYYYSCRGGKVTYDATNLVYNDPALAYFLIDELNSVMDRLQMNLVEGETITFADKDAAGTFNFRTSPTGEKYDTVTTLTNFTGAFSVGEVWYCMSGKCSFDGFMYKLDFEFYIQDYYDFYTPLDYNGDDQSGHDVFGVYNDELAYLVYRGKAMPFETTGIFKDSVEWPATRAIGGR